MRCASPFERDLDQPLDVLFGRHQARELTGWPVFILGESSRLFIGVPAQRDCHSYFIIVIHAPVLRAAALWSVAAFIAVAIAASTPVLVTFVLTALLPAAPLLPVAFFFTFTTIITSILGFSGRFRIEGATEGPLFEKARISMQDVCLGANLAT